MLLAGLAGLFLLPSPWNVVAVCVAAIIEVAEVGLWMRFLRRYRVRTGAEGMLGERAEAIDAVGVGSGRVRVHGEIWAARSRTPLGPGERARVVGVDGLTLEVEPDPARSSHGKGPL
jgi:membrane-bound serine protease (ClpP class)